MTKLSRAVLLATFSLAASTAAWAEIDVTVDAGAVWQTQKIGDNTQGFLQIHNTSKTQDVLTGWDCSIAQATQLLGADRQPLARLVIPAGQTVFLAANGPHLVLQSTHYTVQSGSLVPCALTFQNSGAIGVYLNAEPAP